MYATGHNPSNADDTPDYGSFLGVGSWNTNDWITWHKSLLAKYGEQKAHDTWISAWNNQGFFDWDYSWSKYDQTFNDYVHQWHLDASNFLADTTVKVTQTVTSILDAVKTSTKTIPIILGAAAAIGATVLIISLAGAAKKATA